MYIGSIFVWMGFDVNGEFGIGLFEVIGFFWVVNIIIYFGLIDMVFLCYVKKKSYGLCIFVGMLFGYYIVWIFVGIMGVGIVVLVKKFIVELDFGDVVFYVLGLFGLVIVIVVGWIIVNVNLYCVGFVV